MSQLRIGDIEIDGSRVTIGSPAPTRSDGTAAPLALPKPPAAQHPTDALKGLDELPIPPRWAVAAGLVSMLIGLAGLVWWRPATTWAFLLEGGSFITFGLGLVTFGGLRAWRINRLRDEGAREFEIALTPTIDRLRVLLAQPDPSHGFEWIRDQTQLPHETLLRAMGSLRASGDLVEEFNEITNDWHYFCAPSGLTLDARLRALERSNKP
jgi:hypothetical protein